MSDIPNIETRTTEMLDKMDAQAKSVPQRGVSVVKVSRPADVNQYNIPTRNDTDAVMAELEKLLRFYIGEEAYAVITKKSEGVNMKPLPYFRDRLWWAMENWDFDALDAPDKRTKECRDINSGTSKQLIEVLSLSLFQGLCRKAEERNASNISSLRVGVQRCIDKGVI